MSEIAIFSILEVRNVGTVIVSPGYFAQQGQWPLVFMFAVLLVLDVLCVVRLCVAGKF